MVRLTIRIDLDEKRGFGPGKAKLLETLKQEGSIRRAAVAMGMSYRRAWLLIQDIEATTGGPVVIAKKGGSGGGGVALTALGHKVIARYRAIERRAGRSVAAELRALAKICRSRSGSSSKRRSLSRR